MPAAFGNEYSLTSAYTHVRINATSGNYTLYLPPASGFIGQELSIIKIDNTTNTITIAPAQSSSDTINGINTLTTQWQVARLRSIGTAWDKC